MKPSRLPLLSERRAAFAPVALFAALLDIDSKKALPIVALGVFIADVIMSVLTYGVGAVFGF